MDGTVRVSQKFRILVSGMSQKYLMNSRFPLGNRTKGVFG